MFDLGKNGFKLGGTFARSALKKLGDDSMAYQENKRKFFHNFSVKLGLVFGKIPLTPNQWSLASLIPAILAVYFLKKGVFLEAGVLFFLALFIDWIDGSVARVVGQSTAMGAFVDTIIDRYVEGLVIVGLLFSSLPDLFIPVRGWILTMLFGFMMTTYVKASAKEKGIIKEEHSGSFLNRAERTAVLGIGILAAALNPIYLTYAIAILAVLTNLAAIQRILIARGAAGARKA